MSTMLANVLRSQRRLTSSVCKRTTVALSTSRNISYLHRTLPTQSHHRPSPTPSRPFSELSSPTELIPKRKIYATNIPKPYDIEEIKDIFSQFGTVENVKMGRGLHRIGYFAEITFKDHASTRKALDTTIESPLQLGMNVLKIELSRPATTSTTLRIASTKTGSFKTEEQVRDALKGLTIVESHYMGTHPKRTFIKFRSNEKRMAALPAVVENINGGKLKGGFRRLGFSFSGDDALFFKGLRNTDEEVKEVFKDFSDVDIYTLSPLPPVMYVTFDSVDTAAKARDIITKKGWLARYSGPILTIQP